jgi:pimeloyl-ACP methyl ester carboxylesterase
MAGECASVASGRLRNLLCRALLKRNAAGPQLELLGIVGWLQILSSGMQMFKKYIDGVLGFIGASALRRAAIPLAGHLPQAEQPKQVTAALLDFLQPWRI